ncbi:MAG: hypothetical protein RBU30_26430, partial [Polyangia bacterium]|nr:hypothetical protein [Polyangia bacterium]
MLQPGPQEISGTSATRHLAQRVTFFWALPLIPLFALPGLGACSDNDDSTGLNNNNITRPFCGDGVVDDAEECDQGEDNSDTEPDRCRTGCTSPSCGDQVVDTGHGEECDDGPANSDSLPNACRSDCRAAHCGDGVVDPGRGETCDDGNTVSGDGCDGQCRPEYCGNGVVDPGEECDGGEGCGPSCLLHRCGNGVV